MEAVVSAERQPARLSGHGWDRTSLHPRTLAPTTRAIGAAVVSTLCPASVSKRSMLSSKSTSTMESAGLLTCMSHCFLGNLRSGHICHGTGGSERQAADRIALVGVGAERFSRRHERICPASAAHLGVREKPNSAAQGERTSASKLYDCHTITFFYYDIAHDSTVNDFIHIVSVDSHHGEGHPELDVV